VTFAESLHSTLAAARGIAGSLGLHPFRCYVVTRTWTGSTAGAGTSTDSETELLENGQAPKVKTLDGEELALNNLDSGSIRIGPLTPEHGSGGLDLDTIQSTLTVAQERFVKVTGPGREDGVLFRIKDANLDSSLHYTIIAGPLQEQA